ncbi:unnamed protein product [Cylindrotheca closterium]|uniref:Uncharacterized protein n=1 Tax=Cylindrotheca closterium TaxID=2856 RepID=A0AAD2FGR8_9STRA|nr:unnamed protein product [Cylindrotheca closterium]
MSVLREMIAAGPGCALANGMLNGLETTKVKMQLHNHASPVYHNLTTQGVMKQIIQEEGIINGLLKPGLSASLTRSMLYGAYRVGLYSTARDYLGGDSPRLSHRIVSGMFTGGLGAMLTCPLDVIRTRMQADAGVIRRGVYQTGLRTGFPVRYGTLYSTFVAILQGEGLRNGLYRGASVTIARASVLNGAQLASYDSLKHVIPLPEGPFLHIVCAFSSGVIAQSVVMPMDTIKSSLMIGESRQRVVEAMMKNGGIRWLYRGYLPACAGQGLIMVLQMPLIEQFRKLLGAQPI